MRMWEVFHEARGLDSEQRESFLSDACAGDDALLTEVQELLSAHERSGGFLKPTEIEPPPVGIVESQPIAAGTRIGRYTLQRTIASGGMGIVYEAVQEQPDRTVALKVMRSGLTSRRAWRRFEYESQILGRLQHPGIAQVYEAGTHDNGAGGVPFFAMELIHGAPLTTYAEEHDLSVRQRLALLAQICESVHHAHLRGVVHRDLKPSNILVDSSGQPKVLDFGVALITDTDILVATMQTELPEVVGTVPYMSPEQFAGDAQKIDALSDVYSLGVVGYELLAGRLPYSLESSSIFEAARIIRDQAPPPLGDSHSSLRGDIETILTKALEKEPARRYASAAELADDIHRVLDDRPIMARPHTRAYQFRKFATRNKAVCVAALALVAGTVASSWLAVRAFQAESQAVARSISIREIARSIIFDLHDEIVDLPGSTPARKILVERGLKYLKELRAEAGDDPALLRDVAAAYEKIGDIQKHLGDLAGARVAYDESLSIRSALRDEGSDLRATHDLGRSYMKRGLVNNGDEGILDFYGPARRLLEDVVSRNNDPNARCDLAMVLVYDALYVDRQQEFERSRDQLDQAVEMCEILLEAHPANADYSRALAEACFYRGYVERHGPDQERAVRNFAKAAVLLEAMNAEDPLDTFTRHWLANTYIERAMTVALLGRAEEAIAEANRAIEIRFEMIESDPASYLYFRSAEVACNHTGELYAALGDNDGFSVAQRLLYWRESLRWYEVALERHKERQKRWLVPKSDDGYAEEDQVAISQCQEEIRRLEMQQNP